MNTYTRNYRKIYENYHGSIPKDETGRTYDIHHIDGDRTNNDISNLRAVTIQEHYDIHYAQEDYYACYLIAVKMRRSKEEISRIASLAQKKLVTEGKHHLLGGAIARSRVKNGTHHFLGGKIQRQAQKKLVTEGKHHLLGGIIQAAANRKRVEDGTHNFLTMDKSKHFQDQIQAGKHSSQIKVSCTCCRNVFSVNMIGRHAAKCLLKPK